MKISVPAALGLLLAISSTAGAQTAVKPYFMVIVDNSGSMDDGSTGSGDNSCGEDRIPINDAKCVLQNIVSGYGDVGFGLIRYRLDEPCTGSCGGCGDGFCGCGCANINFWILTI